MGEKKCLFSIFDIVHNESETNTFTSFLTVSEEIYPRSQKVVIPEENRSRDQSFFTSWGDNAFSVTENIAKFIAF